MILTPQLIDILFRRLLLSASTLEIRTQWVDYLNRFIGLNLDNSSDTKVGVLEKRGLGSFYKPWSLRRFRYHRPSKMLQYFDLDGAFKGSVFVDTTTFVQVVSADEADGRRFAFRVMCWKGLLEHFASDEKL